MTRPVVVDLARYRGSERGQREPGPETYAFGVPLPSPSSEWVAGARDSFLGRCVHRFLEIRGIDRSMVLSSQAFTALIPLMHLQSPLTMGVVALVVEGPEDTWEVVRGMMGATNPRNT